MTEKSKSKRISKTKSITLNGSLENVFPLFGPIRESEWAAGWNPEILFSNSDLVEEHMLFRIPSHHGDGEPDHIWTVSKYEPEKAFIEYTVFSGERIWWITIKCIEGIPGQSTQAEITYTYNGLTQLGNAINERALQSIFANDLKDWETAINHYLKTGVRLEHH